MRKISTLLLALAASFTMLQGATIDLATLTEDYTLQDGDTLTGTLSGVYQITVADGATVTLNGVAINAASSYNSQWPGISCFGSATLIIAGENSVQGNFGYSGIYFPQNNTLTIQGDGSLTATGGDDGAGIGGGRDNERSCGNIIINSGTITAIGASGIGSGGRSEKACRCGDITINGGTITANGGGAGIGSAVSSICGNISINGGTITATGGAYSAGIGSGNNGYCGDITIGNGITSVTATKGQYGWSPIGNGESGSCGTITIASSLNDVTESNTRTLTPSSTPTAIDNTSISTKSTKRIVNGQLLIERGNKTYTLTGQEVK